MKFLVSLFLLTPLLVHAGPDCIGYTQKNLETGVGKGGNLRPLLCGCSCNDPKFGRTHDNKCLNCMHHQAGKKNGVTIKIDPKAIPTITPQKRHVS